MYYVQYHNCDSLGRYPMGDIDFTKTVDELVNDDAVKFGSQFWTRKKAVIKTIGQSCFLIIGKTEQKVKKYFLWSYFSMEQVDQNEDGFYNVSGTGYNFKRPVLLNDLTQFDDFKKFCGNFGIGFQPINNHIFCKTLCSYIKGQVPDSVRDALTALNALMLNIKPKRQMAQIERILRSDGKIVELIKKNADYKCQFPNCCAVIMTKEGINYVEVAHIHAVHKGGQSIIGNLLVLCPNHHKEFDYGHLQINEQSENSLTGTLNGKAFSIKL